MKTKCGQLIFILMTESFAPIYIELDFVFILVTIDLLLLLYLS